MADSGRSRFHIALTIEGYSERVEAGFVIEEQMYAALRDVVHLLEKARDDQAFLYIDNGDSATVLTPSSIRMIHVQKGEVLTPTVESTDEGEVRYVSEYVAQQDGFLLRRL